MRLTQEEALERIAAEGDSAQALLLEAIPGARRKFNAIDRALIKLLAEVREHFPDAMYYTASGGFNLMIGASHGGNQQPQRDLVALGGFAQISDGDF